MFRHFFFSLKTLNQGFPERECAAVRGEAERPVRPQRGRGRHQRGCDEGLPGQQGGISSISFSKIVHKYLAQLRVNSCILALLSDSVI